MLFIEYIIIYILQTILVGVVGRLFEYLVLNYYCWIIDFDFLELCQQLSLKAYFILIKS